MTKLTLGQMAEFLTQTADGSNILSEADAGRIRECAATFRFLDEHGAASVVVRNITARADRRRRILSDRKYFSPENGAGIAT